MKNIAHFTKNHVTENIEKSKFLDPEKYLQWKFTFYILLNISAVSPSVLKVDACGHTADFENYSWGTGGYSNTPTYALN